jgi:hypothetical protein
MPAYSKICNGYIDRLLTYYNDNKNKVGLKINGMSMIKEL